MRYVTATLHDTNESVQINLEDVAHIEVVNGITYISMLHANLLVKETPAEFLALPIITI